MQCSHSSFELEEADASASRARSSSGQLSGSSRSLQASAPVHQTSWLGTSWLMLADIVGTSVLTYAGVARQLGWVLTILFIVLLSPIAVYTAVLMSRTGTMLMRNKGVRPQTMGEAGRLTLGGDNGAKAVYGVVYGFAFLGQSSYLLVLGQTFQGIFYDFEFCLPTSVLISVGLCLPFAVSIRRLSESVWLCFVNLLLILLVLGIVMTAMAYDGRQQEAKTFLFAQDLSLLTVFGSMTNIVFSYAGHWLYFEIMSEMHEPETFPRVFYINMPLQIGLYLLVACWGYYYAGDLAKGYFLDNLPNGLAYRVASVLLFAHVIVAFLIKNVVLTRYVHGLVAPSRVSTHLSEPGGARAHVEYVCCGLLLQVACFLVANAVPFFSEFLGLVGGLLSGPISFLLPMVLYRRALAQRPDTGATQGDASFEDVSKLPTALAPDGLDTPLQDAGKLSSADRVLFAAVGLITLLTMVFGTYQEVLQVIANVDKIGPPFSCQPLPADRQR
mmetsp:Transcript_89498/g.261576  ORF Transcript_89498/g.261576 Transcript_89498/m.261576 type:complete len:499 (+) Transcript_89498:38-1534(+)